MAQDSRRRYLNDYEVIPYVGANGKSKQKLRYVGSWYCISDDATTDKKILQLHILSYIVATAVLLALLLNHSAYLTMYVSVPAVIALFPIAYLLMGSFRLPWKARPLRRDERDKSLNRMWRSAVGILILFGIVTVGYVVFWFVAGERFVWQDTAFLLCSAVVLLGSFRIYRVGKSVEVAVHPNDLCPVLYL